MSTAAQEIDGRTVRNFVSLKINENSKGVEVQTYKLVANLINFTSTLKDARPQKMQERQTDNRVPLPECVRHSLVKILKR